MHSYPHTWNTSSGNASRGEGASETLDATLYAGCEIGFDWSVGVEGAVAGGMGMMDCSAATLVATLGPSMSVSGSSLLHHW